MSSCSTLSACPKVDGPSALSHLCYLAEQPLHRHHPWTDVSSLRRYAIAPSRCGVLKLARIVNGVAKSIVSARPDSAFGQHLFVIYGTSFWSISVALNVLTTLLIAGKLLYHQREMSRLGQPSKYLSLVAICVESAAIYSISGLVYIPLFALNLPHQYAFSALVGSATVRLLPETMHFADESFQQDDCTNPDCVAYRLGSCGEGELRDGASGPHRRINGIRRAHAPHTYLTLIVVSHPQCVLGRLKVTGNTPCPYGRASPDGEYAQLGWIFGR